MSTFTNICVVNMFSGIQRMSHFTVRHIDKLTAPVGIEVTVEVCARAVTVGSDRLRSGFPPKTSLKL